MATLCLQEEEMLVEKVKGFPVSYDKRAFKEKDAVQSATNSICADIILDFGRLTIQNSSFQ